MKLHVGERLIGRPNQPGGYVVTALVRQTPWGCLYAGKKIFANFDFAAKRPREADEKEWLDVYLRTLEYRHLDDPEYVAERRRLARHEVRRVLGNRATSLWPEPVDVLEVVNTRDPFSGLPAEALRQEPILVFACPQGETLTQWQAKNPVAPRVLAVLAELLEFLDTAHRDGLLLPGLSPDGVQIDRADRVHFLATDLVLEARPSADLPTAPGRGRAFPPERFPRGFAAPECFDAEAALDARTDLYSWAALAVFLLTGARPDQGAAAFRREHQVALERVLRGIPPAQVRTWLEQLGVPAAIADWPRNLLGVLRRSLGRAPRVRPADVAQVRHWLASPPSESVVAAIAARSPGTPVMRIHLDVGGIEPRSSLVVRHGRGAAPQTFEEGEIVAEGPPAPWMDLPLGMQGDLPAPSGQESQYSVFTRSLKPGAEVSPAAVVGLVDPSATGIRQFVEELESAAGPAPPEVGLLFRALDPTQVAEALLESGRPAVRGWALDQLAWKERAEPVWAEKFLWRALKDQVPALRLQSAATLLRSRPAPAQARGVIEALGETVEQRLEAAHSLRQLGVGDDVLRPVLDALGDEQPTQCHECGLELPRRDRAAHLTQAHDYVRIFGVLWPRPTAIARLWQQIFSDGDAAWGEELARVLCPAGSDNQAALLAAALEAELCRRGDAGEPSPPDQKAALARALRPSLAWRSSFPLLLHSQRPGVRALGRDLLLPELFSVLAGELPTAAEVRRQLDRACGAAPAEEKIHLSRMLSEAGVDPSAALGSLAQLEQELATICPECQTSVVTGDLELHLRRAHGLYQFRGEQRTLERMLKMLLGCVCSASPDYPAFKALLDLAEEAFPSRSDLQVAEWLVRKLADRTGDLRPVALLAVAEASAASGAGPRLVPHLVRLERPSERSISWQLALEIVARVPPPVTAALIQAVLPLLGNRRLPLESRCAAVASLLRTAGRDSRASEDLVEAFVQRASTKRSLEWLERLEERAGPVPALEARRAELESRLRMLCPRCGVEMRRKEMDAHLWDEHRLLREGRRVREPWRVVEDWVADYRLEKDPAVLARCRELALRTEGERGILTLGRSLLRHGVEEPHTRHLLLDEAQRERGTLCPRCFALVPLPEAPAPPCPRLSGGRLEGDGFRVSVSVGGLLPRLAVAAPQGVVYRGREPGKRLTRLGRAAVLVGCPLALAVSFLLTAPLTEGRLLAPAALALGAAMMMAGYVCLTWRPEAALRDRVLEHAWSRLVPRLLGKESRAGWGGAADLAFVAGLARLSVGAGRPEIRGGPLQVALDRVESLLRDEKHDPLALAALWRLAAEDRALLGGDPVPTLVDQIGRCLDGEFPLRYAGPLLENLAGPPWSKATLARLRILVCARAMNAGYEVIDLIRAGRGFPPLGALLRLEPSGLAKLRLLWSLQRRRPWERISRAPTVFELARDPDALAPLEESPDLLLADPQFPICLTARGVDFLGTLFAHMPESIAVRQNREFQDGGFELVVADRRFHFHTDPDDVAARLEQWLRFYFGEFLPQAYAHQYRSSPDVLARLQAVNAVLCPECKRPFLPQFGDVGVRPEGGAEARADAAASELSLLGNRS